MTALSRNPYLRLVKPGIVGGNLVSVAGGFLLGARGAVDLSLFVATLLGVALVVAGGCVVNNVIDRDIDARMARTATRPMVTGAVGVPTATVYGGALAGSGLLLLALIAGPLAATVAAFGLVIYVGPYSLWFKRRSPISVLVGSLAGATPPVIGYCAVTGRLDAAAAILFLMFALWQIPHSDAIAVMRRHDYAAAGVPTYPFRHGIAATKQRMLVSIGAFGAASVALPFAGFTGLAYLCTAVACAGYWLHLAATGPTATTERSWAKRIFLASLGCLLALCVLMAVDFR
ncbi:protoheme IX farnesyltransferase [Pleomorphomonas diazotrophica]|uniref:Protoheme IX farnesyltransferase n=1 Tax=Pleomorphomonas diazotrophica TaxID=1166257 RepID=A0A1I4USR5_9HYPH|nr:heme o synthase [Pleomorphomonas diazotrophica]PKR89860.1 protoheme IX farnesyltransferase [Pleomorphomonas diazotrophica]SFM92019.1 protoheme IX farnesyltransferase [Pleomorphomonas diazotrophica]